LKSFELQVDLLNDISHAPRIMTSFAQAIQPASFKQDLDSYLKTRAPVTFLSELRSHLQVISLTNCIVKVAVWSTRIVFSLLKYGLRKTYSTCSSNVSQHL